MWLFRSFISEEREREPTKMKVVERVEAHYDVQAVEFGRVYKWRPESVLIECGCGERLYLSTSVTSCGVCGADHTVVIQEELAGVGCRRTKPYIPGVMLGIDKMARALSEEGS